MRLIDAEALEKIFEERIAQIKINCGAIVTIFKASLEVLLKDVKSQPTIEAKPIVHAYWKNWGCEGTVCSNCYGRVLYECDEHEKKSKYCPHCGAQMDEKGG